MFRTNSFYFKFIIQLVLLFIFIHIGCTQPTFSGKNVEEHDQLKDYLIGNYPMEIGQFIEQNPPKMFIDYHDILKSDDNQFKKRIIMLPRVGRRYIRSN